MLKIQMLEQIVTNESVLEDEAVEEEQKVLENEERQERQHQNLSGSLSTGASPQRLVTFFFVIS